MGTNLARNLLYKLCLFTILLFGEWATVESCCKSKTWHQSCKTCHAGCYKVAGTIWDDCKACSNPSCPAGQYRSGSCSGKTNGYQCNTCSKLTCPAGQYRS